MPSEEVPVAMTDRALALTAVGAHRVWDLEAEAEVVVQEVAVQGVVGVGGADRSKGHECRRNKTGAQNEINICE
jgi:hypothetical protein